MTPKQFFLNKYGVTMNQ